MQFYLSEILKKPVLNKSGEKIGLLDDIVINDIGKSTPTYTGLVMQRGARKEAVFIPSHDLAILSPKQIQQSTNVVNLAPFKRRDDEVLLYSDVYDKQI